MLVVCCFFFVISELFLCLITINVRYGNLIQLCFVYLQKGIAGLYPKPRDLEKYVRAYQYSTKYDDMMSAIYDWPETDTVFGFPIPKNNRKDDH